MDLDGLSEGVDQGGSEGSYEWLFGRNSLHTIFFPLLFPYLFQRPYASNSLKLAQISLRTDGKATVAARVIVSEGW